MIRRTSENSWLLIAQTEHARIAAELARAWGNDRFAPLSLADWLVPAIRHHDDGWSDWDDAPHVDPETGTPRDFTEMAMADATAIWRRSIAVCSRAAGRAASGSQCLARLDNWLRPQQLPLTRDHEFILAQILEATEPLTEQTLTESADEASDETAAQPVPVILQQLQQAGVIVPRTITSETGFVLSADLQAPSPFGGLWVSRHFCDLAIRARENRTEAADLAAIDDFLNEQAPLQAEWREQLAAQIPEDELEPLIELGFRCVQRFDHLSLWLCCAERDKPFELAFPGAGQIHFIPGPDGQVVVDPWPFAADRLELVATPVRIPRQSYRNDEALHTEMAASRGTVLRWILLSAQ
ncbi:hypothetical protein Mal4_41710 [Maioricimonas rarisocia]|uniref:DUF3891 domain-containing protein n=1 Tax=Maioricimonas rarisocia TaxID=2528026 RepID=A0A517ZBF2_9PLAN|nr:DUF3891 family protein [Maioricimonas rarisocia]QDU39823.1 hypothetical protein Mal4_41710 [Maioricimonas rarisocia]